MAFAPASLLLLYGLTALNWTIHFYTHVVTYRLFSVIAANADGAGFVRYHQAYERKLPWSIYMPWSMLVAASILYLVAAPSVYAATLLLLNLSIAVISVVFAVPTHRRIGRIGAFTDRDATILLRANLLRLLVATLSLALVSGLLFIGLV